MSWTPIALVLKFLKLEDILHKMVEKDGLC